MAGDTTPARNPAQENTPPPRALAPKAPDQTQSPAPPPPHVATPQPAGYAPTRTSIANGASPPIRPGAGSKHGMDDDSGNQDGQGPGTEKKKRKGRMPGAQSLLDPDKQRIFQAIRRVMPEGPKDWEKVSEEYSRVAKEVGRKPRDADYLKKYFLEKLNEALLKPSGDATLHWDVREARAIQMELEARGHITSMDDGEREDNESLGHGPPRGNSQAEEHEADVVMTPQPYIPGPSTPTPYPLHPQNPHPDWTMQRSIPPPPSEAPGTNRPAPLSINTYRAPAIQNHNPPQNQIDNVLLTLNRALETLSAGSSPDSSAKIDALATVYKSRIHELEEELRVKRNEVAAAIKRIEEQQNEISRLRIDVAVRDALQARGLDSAQGSRSMEESATPGGA